MSEQKNSYRQIFKATSIFGGVQVVNILIGIVRSKLVALLLGAVGMGVTGLLQATLSLIQSIAGMGLASSAVRDVSEANGTGNKERLAIVITTLRRWVWVTGMLGTLFTLCMASFLSQWTFGNKDYTWAFIILAITLLLTDLTNGQNVLLQGMRKVKDMAKSSMYGSLIGLLTSVPLYFLYGLQGIVPAILVTAVVTYILSSYFANKINIKSVKLTWKESYTNGLSMAKLGFVMMLSSFMYTLVSYVINIVISKGGGIAEVGLYRAGWSISTQYVGLIFTAMGTDYFPRLAGINHDREQMETLVNQQGEIAILILGPLLIVLIGFVPLVIKMFYVSSLLPISGMIKWNMLGMLFKAASWSIAFVIVAKGHSKLFFIQDLILNVVILILNVVGYSIWRLDGIGISFFISYILYFILVIILVYKYYLVKFRPVFWKLFMIQLGLTVLAFLISYIDNRMLVYTLIAILFVASTLYSLYELNKKIELKALVNKILKK